MPNSTPPPWTRPSEICRWAVAASAAAALLLAALPAAAEPHLSITPRSPAEAERIARVTAPTSDFTKAEPFEARPGGAATQSTTIPGHSLSQPSANMAAEREMDFRLGEALFAKLWVAAPSATTASDGLGPLFNGRSCDTCHVGNGRGRPAADPDDHGGTLVLRLSRPAAAMDLPAQPIEPEPVYGTQLQDKSVPGLAAEGRIEVAYTPLPVTLDDGTRVTLRKPAYTVANPAYGPLDKDTRLSPRIAPPLIGLGLLEAIPAEDILAHADPDDRDADGISGRANRVWSREIARLTPGRFGWKAGQPTLAQQGADAFAMDIGISSPLDPAPWGDCTDRQLACRTAPHGQSGNAEGLEIPAAAMDLVTYYARNLAPPARENPGAPEVLRGKALFYQAGCPACHVPKFVTHRLAERPEQSFQLIWPYSDLLLHDMGEGLADGSPEWQATGREWRTAPLWGIGKAQAIADRPNFLHDGRARSLEEAILWHGGEAAAAQGAYRSMGKSGRSALITFLESL